MEGVERKVYQISPCFLMEYEELIRRHAQYGGGAEGEKYTGGKTFSNVYEMYIYAFFLGLHRGIKVEILSEDKTKTFWEIANWKPKELVDNLLACAIGVSDLDMNAVECMGGEKVQGEIRKLKRSIEEYANGGLKYIHEKVESEPDLIDDDMFFISLLSE